MITRHMEAKLHMAALSNQDWGLFAVPASGYCLKSGLGYLHTERTVRTECR